MRQHTLIEWFSNDCQKSCNCLGFSWFSHFSLALKNLSNNNIIPPIRNKQVIGVGLTNKIIKFASDVINYCSIGFGLCHTISFSK